MKGFTIALFVALLVPQFAVASNQWRCSEAVQQQLQRELDQLHAVLQQHHNGAFVDGRVYGLPKNDFDDSSNLTIRQRIEFRRMRPSLGYPTSGPVQYPRMAYELMNRRDFENTTACGPMLQPLVTLGTMLPYGPIVLSNVNVTANSTPESENYLAIDPNNASIMIGASNTNVPGPGGQMMYQSLNGGSTWAVSQLTPTRKYHSDPWVSINSTGVAYTATLDYSSSKTQVKFYKSTDHGSTWPSQLIVDDSSGDDKESAAADYQSTSSCKDQLYMGWDNGKAMYISSTTAPNSGTFRAKTSVQGSPSFSIASDIAIGPPATSGAAAPAYYVWTNTGQKAINFSKSTNCGATWSTYKTIATTNDAYDYGIPAQCNRRVLIYPSIDADRSTGTHRGWIYVAWNDFTVAQGNGCAAANSADNSNVWFIRSSDGGNTWSTPVKAYADPPSTDQFNQWMRVDDFDGSVHLMWHDSRNDPNRAKTDVYYARSTDGGTTFSAETKITTEQSDESTAGASPDQYGDYEGLAVKNGCAFPFWTDRRASSGTDEEVFTNKTCP